MSEGKFIVFYGINILGKTTQSGIISRQIALENSVRVHRIKYPIYNLDPTGSEINNYLMEEDFGILFDGEQFNHREESHKYETNYNLTKKCREIHLRLAEEFGIPVINANQEKEKVTKDIL